jgi:hypothetical protein
MATRKFSSNGNTDPDITAQARETIGAVNAVASPQPVKSPDKSKVPLHTIAVRINEVDYNRLNSLFTAQGTNLAAAGKAAIFYLAEQVDSGKLSIPNGVIVHNQVRA